MHKRGRKIVVGVVMGGPSLEHAVSLKTGEAVLRHLDDAKYHAQKLVIPKKFVPGGSFERRLMRQITGVDVVMNAMHGAFGEDGKAQALFSYCNVPTTGSDAVASALAMDKYRSRFLFRTEGLLTPKTFLISQHSENNNELLKRQVRRACGKAPWVVKPRANGSSVGVSIAHSGKELERAMVRIFRLGDDALIEEYIRGTEVTVPVLERRFEKPEALPIIEIKPHAGKFFDYHEKYSASGAEEIVPARISKRITRHIQAAALRAHHVLGCRGYSRTDFIIRNEKPIILELNTLPGLTSASLFPKSAQVAGIDFPELLDILLNQALRQKSHQ